ncbi:MAG: hypothetical protein AABY39_06625 [Nitrospirota bacterium]
MPEYLPFVLVGVAVVLLLVWSIKTQIKRNRRLKAALEQLGFQPCPEKKSWLEEIVTRIENNKEFRYEVREPKRLPGEPAVYYYIKYRHGGVRENADAEEEILFPLKRPSSDGLILIVKPSSLAPGLATRMIGAIATAQWDAQPDDLQRLELPPDLKDTNLMGALGPPGVSLYNLIDMSALSVVQGLGDAGGMMVRFRDSWCSVASASAQIPFCLEELVGRIRPLL